MALVVEQECPQCGAPVELEETHRLLCCPFCNVKSLMFAEDCFRYVLPHATSDKRMLYAPYIRFRGAAYLCAEAGIEHRIVDLTRLAAPVDGIPVSLGLRPQAMKMRFLKPGHPGIFLKRKMTLEEALDAVGSFTSAFMARNFFHRAYIGETFSVIYLPLYSEKKELFDAVTQVRLTSMPAMSDVLEDRTEAPQWRLAFLATLCPNCGCDLDAERDSVVLPCPNCCRAWQAADGRLDEVIYKIVPGDHKKAVYLPFWKMVAETEEGLPVRSYAEFLRVTNQPKMIQPRWESLEMSFWAPAFKIRPNIFLNLSKQLTVSQEDFDMKDDGARGPLYPVTLPLAEARQSLKLILADAIMNKRNLFPSLPRVRFSVGTSMLVYLPFVDTGQEIIQEHKPIAIHKQALEFGRCL
jgi:predicted RNA-binding Zn-ribbon protein involved in translation (DUF1610 family)